MRPSIILIFFLLIALVLACSLFSCTETIYEEVLKTDTVFVNRPVMSFVTLPATRDTIFIRDTVRIETVITNTDTLLQVVTKDSLIIKVVEKEIYIRDTVVVTNTVKETVTLTDTITVVEYETRIVYLNTEYIYIFPGQSVTYIPEPFEPHFQAFRDEANARNKPLPGGDMVLMRIDPSELAGDNWVSDSWEVAGFQWILRISDQLTVEQSRSAIFRELARMQLGKKYVTDQNKIMCPWHNVNEPMTTQQLNDLFL